jgi:hypothetical protein
MFIIEKKRVYVGTIKNKESCIRPLSFPCLEELVATFGPITIQECCSRSYTASSKRQGKTTVET